MIGFRYSDFDSSKFNPVENFKQLMELFNMLLLKTHGDAEKALEIMKNLQGRGYIPEDFDLDGFVDKLEEKQIVQKDGATGKHVLTDKGVQGMRKSSLERSFRDLREGDGSGQHRTTRGDGESPESLPETRDYQFGDDIENIHFTESLWNSFRREGSLDASLQEEDLVVQDREKNTSCSTVLLLDISHSMILYGEDRFTPAKQVALALTELILSRFKRDTLDIVLFGNEAIPVPVKKLPFVGVGPFHTNTKAGLQFARKILERRKSSNKQIFMVTDGKPTVIDIPGEGVYRNTFGLDERIINRTLDEAVVCRRKGIRITTFMVTRDPYLEQFVHRLTELNRGKAYFSSPDRLGGFLFMDFLRNRKNKSR